MIFLLFKYKSTSSLLVVGKVHRTALLEAIVSVVSISIVSVSSLFVVSLVHDVHEPFGSSFSFSVLGAAADVHVADEHQEHYSSRCEHAVFSDVAVVIV